MCVSMEEGFQCLNTGWRICIKVQKKDSQHYHTKSSNEKENNIFLFDAVML